MLIQPCHNCLMLVPKSASYSIRRSIWSWKLLPYVYWISLMKHNNCYMQLVSVLEAYYLTCSVLLIITLVQHRCRDIDQDNNIVIVRHSANGRIVKPALLSLYSRTSDNKQTHSNNRFISVNGCIQWQIYVIRALVRWIKMSTRTFDFRFQKGFSATSQGTNYQTKSKYIRSIGHMCLKVPQNA